MMIPSTKYTILIALLLLPCASIARADDADVLRNLRKGHPRLLVLDNDIARAKELIQSDPTAKAYFDELKTVCEKVLTEPVSQRIIVGPRLLTISRQVLGRTEALGAMYRLTGDRRFADRARDEMLAAAAFVNWNPSHFLDVAEMTNGLALGYDWIYDTLSDDERRTIKQAILEKGLEPGLAVYASGKGWPTITNNWNQVCNGGMTIGALAIADEEPDVARKVIESARESLPRAMSQFAPDGGCIEGPGYWNYATVYTTYYLAALQSALGTDFGFKSTEGLAETGLFRIHSLAPTGRTFNFADADDGPGTAWQMFWMAHAFKHPEYAAFERAILKRKGAHVSTLHLLFYTAQGNNSDIAKLPTSALYKRINVAFFRSAWNDPSAAFVGFKAGDNAASHAHLDLGSFVYDVGGVRWALDLGRDDYNLPGYFGAQRWSYFRMNNSSHNTLTIDGKNQNLRGKAPIVAFSSADRKLAVADLTDAYKGQVTRAARGIELLSDRSLLVQDELQADQPAELVWAMFSDAQVAADLAQATLHKGEKQITARILAPADAHFELDDPNPPPPQRQQPDLKRLSVRVKLGKSASTRIAVLLSPAGAKSPPALAPLSDWPNSGAAPAR